MAGSLSSENSATSSPSSTRTRTLAIILAHAADSRFQIESRITSSGFEIIKERQMGFDHEDGAVYELFAEAAPTLCGEPVWIYVLERRRAVEVLKSLMGDEDPELARIAAPDSLRALYGIDIAQNAVYGSPDAAMADLQINSIFVSSPPFPPVNEPELEQVPVQSLEYNREAEETEEYEGGGESYHGGGESYHGGGSGSGGSTNGARVDIKSKTQGFKARAVPTTTAVPSIQPRTTRAAALRAGVDLPSNRRAPASRESIARTFENVPGHKRASLILNVASTAPPVLAPRQTKASALRTGAAEPALPPGKKGPPKKSEARKPNSPDRIAQIFDNVPGHKRRSTIAVASTAPPTIAPRATKASALRTGQSPTTEPVRPRASTGPSDSRQPERKKSTGTFDNVPGHKRSMTIEVPSVRPPVEPPRANRSSALRTAPVRAPPSSFFMKSSYEAPTLARSASQNSMRPTAGRRESSSGRSASVEPGQREGRSGNRSSIAAPPAPPSIEPRSNRSALLRAAQMAGGSNARVAAF